MPLDLEKIKQNLSAEKIKEFFKKGAAPGQAGSKKPTAAWLTNLQQGFKDIQVVLQEGKFILFIKQIVVLLGVFLLVRYGNERIRENKKTLQDKMSKINIEKLNKDDYLANKQHLLRLEPLFPDYPEKPEWMLRHLIDIFDEARMTPKMEGTPAENNAAEVYTVVSHPVTFQQSFANAGKFLESVENGDDFLRISDISITKLTASDTLGENEVKVTFNTVFPKTRYAPTLFKDYAQQMEKLQAQKEAQAKAQGEPKEQGETK